MVNMVKLSKTSKLSKISKLTLSSLLIFISQVAFSQTLPQSSTKAPEGLFQLNENTGALLTNIDELREILLSDKQSIVIALPLPNGTLVNFTLTPEKIMADELAIKYPNIKTFIGISLDNPNYAGRFDITPNGFHGMFYYQGKRVFVEPKSVYIQEQAEERLQKVSRVFSRDRSEYKSYFSQDSRLPNKKPNKEANKVPNAFTHKFHKPKTIPQLFNIMTEPRVSITEKSAKVSATESTMKTYRIAISAAAEYTEFNGGTVDSAMAEIVTLVNRLNQVYQRDLAIKLELVGNNDLLVFTDANADPFANTSDDGEINTSVIDGVIGSENYDIGHVVNTDGGGLAILGGVCHSTYKGDGVTGSPSPSNDAFYIDYVAHEIGHQFGANHTFNGTAGACSENRVADSAYEVGSGSTIMAYAGICDNQNLQSHSDAFFHARSIDQINGYMQNGTGNTCGTFTGDANNTAVVDAGLDYTIPARTPFKLSGNAEDLDSVNLSYSWQQFDLGNESSSVDEQVDDGSRPLFRAFSPDSDAERTFPKFSNVLNNTNAIGESLPTTDRELNFRLMVFDNEGGVSFGEVKLNVVDTGEAFSVISPILDDVWTASSNNINWQVAGTNTTPINCSSVDILLSKDDGESFNINLASGITNNGSNDISIDAFCADEINTLHARIKLVCNNNIFFAINSGSFSIDKMLSSADIAITSQQALSLTQGESLALASSQFTYACETADSITIQAGDNYTFVDETIIPNENFSGALSVVIIANKNSINSEAFVVNITVEAKPEPEPEPVPEPVVAKSSGSVFWLLLCICVLPWRILILAKVKQA